MAVETQEVVEHFPKLKQSVEQSYQAFQGNQKRFQEFMKFVFQDTLSQNDKDVLDLTGKPTLQFNILEPYVSRLLGEFSKQEPNIKVSPVNEVINPITIEAVEGIMRGILMKAKNNSVEYETYKETLGGGYSVLKVWTDYENDHSYDQEIKLSKAFDPTLTGFDPLAELPHKGDGRYCFELHPMSKEEFIEEYGIDNLAGMNFTRSLESFSWSYRHAKEEIVLVCDYYLKKKRKFRLHQLSDGQTISDKEYRKLIEDWPTIGTLAQPPSIVRSRWSSKTVIERFVFTENCVLIHEKTQLPGLPLIFVDGNSVRVRLNESGQSMEQVTRPYVYQAMGAQRLKNFAGQSLGNELENLMQSKYIVEQETIPEDAIEDWIHPQKLSTLVYKSRDEDGNELPPPRPVDRTQIPPIIAQTFAELDRTTQNILGSYDAQLGLNKNQLSGIAIVEGATQNNSVAMPYIQGFLSALNAAAQLILEMIPLYYKTPRTVPVTDKKGNRTYLQINQLLRPGMANPETPQLTYGSKSLEVSVSAGYNFEVQKHRALQVITELMKTSPAFNELMNEQGLPILISNLDIHGRDQLLELTEQWTEKMQSKQNQPNPNPEAMMNAASVKNQENTLKLKAAELAIKSRDQALKTAVDQEKIKTDRAKLELTARETEAQNMIDLKREQTEREVHAAELAIKADEQAHRQAKELLELKHLQEKTDGSS